MENNISNTIVIIPTFNNAGTVGDIISRTLKFGLPVLVVNDGSTDNTEMVLEQFPSISTIHFQKNKGKGSALKTALKQADKQGFRYAITIDADGQHFPEDIPVFLEGIKQPPTHYSLEREIYKPIICPGKILLPTNFLTSGTK